MSDGDSLFTFIYVGWQASDEDLPGVALHPLSVLTAGRRVEAWGQGGVTVAIIEEGVFKGEKTGTTWEREDKGRQG